MACRLFSAKPLSAPMMTYCQLDHDEHISMKYYLKLKSFHSRKCIWKCRLGNGGHVVSVSMSLYLPHWGRCVPVKIQTSVTAHMMDVGGGGWNGILNPWQQIELGIFDPHIYTLGAHCVCYDYLRYKHYSRNSCIIRHISPIGDLFNYNLSNYVDQPLPCLLCFSYSDFIFVYQWYINFVGRVVASLNCTGHVQCKYMTLVNSPLLIVVDSHGDD